MRIYGPAGVLAAAAYATSVFMWSAEAISPSRSGPAALSAPQIELLPEAVSAPSVERELLPDVHYVGWRNIG
jgi:hypothetical protein